MKMRKALSIPLSLILLTASAAAKTSQPTTAAAGVEETGARPLRSSYTVIVAWDPTVVQMDPKEIEVMIPRIRGSQEEALGWNFGNWVGTYRVEYVRGWPSKAGIERPSDVKEHWSVAAFTGSFEFRPRAEYPKMPVLRGEARERLRSRCRDSAQAAHKIIERAWSTTFSHGDSTHLQLRRQYEADRGASTLKLAKARKEVEDIAPLRSMVSQIEMNEVGKRARLEAIRQEISRIDHIAHKRIEDDVIVGELAKIVRVREIELQRTRISLAQNAVTEGEVAQAEGKVSEAKVELARRREAISDAAGGGLLARLNTEQTMLAIDLAEFEARREFLAMRIKTRQRAVHRLEQQAKKIGERYQMELAKAKPWRIVKRVVDAPDLAPEKQPKR